MGLKAVANPCSNVPLSGLDSIIRIITWMKGSCWL